MVSRNDIMGISARKTNGGYIGTDTRINVTGSVGRIEFGQYLGGYAYSIINNLPPKKYTNGHCFINKVIPDDLPNQFHFNTFKLNDFLLKKCLEAKIKIFEDEQNELKSYGTEVSLCQYSVYCRLKANPHLIKKRKIARTTKPTQKILFESTEMEEVLVGETCKVKMVKEEPSTPIVKKIKKAKPKKINLNQSNIDLIKRIMTSLGGTSITHRQVITVIKSEGGHGLKLDSNWKESWAIMQDMVKSNMLEKTDSSYSIKK